MIAGLPSKLGRDKRGQCGFVGLSLKRSVSLIGLAHLTIPNLANLIVAKEIRLKWNNAFLDNSNVRDN